jgi:hypothetical protein
MIPYRWPGLSTHAWLTLQFAARPVAQWIVRECIEARAAYDPGSCGDWCRQLVAEHGGGQWGGQSDG